MGFYLRLILCRHLKRNYPATDGAKGQSGNSGGPMQLHDRLALKGASKYFTSEASVKSSIEHPNKHPKAKSPI
jgi:hypothetical protein